MPALGRRLQLVMAGPSSMEVPNHASIRALGFVDDEVREALLARARVLVMPSPFESLSMVLLEAWNHGVPVLVNARCRVTRGQTERADGGLHFRNVAEFEAALDYLLDHDDDRAQRLGAQGLAYVDREYRWPTVMAKLEALLKGTGGCFCDAHRRKINRPLVKIYHAKTDASHGCLRAVRRLRQAGAAALQAGRRHEAADAGHGRSQRRPSFGTLSKRLTPKRARRKSVRKTDEEWTAVRNAAITVAESGNLLMLVPRAKNGDDWMRLAQQMVNTGEEAIQCSRGEKRRSAVHASAAISTSRARIVIGNMDAIVNANK